MKQRYSYLLAIIAVVFLAICPTQVLAQAKVGTTGGQFLELQFSPRSLGMGAVGITMIDEFAPINSPGALALYYSDRRATLFTLVNYELPASVGLRAYGIGARAMSKPLGKGSSRMTLALAYTRIGVKSGPMIERTYEHGPGADSRVFYANEGADIYSIGLALQGELEFGLGLNYKRIGEEYYDYSTSGTAYDFAGLICYRIDLSPSSIERNYSFAQTLAVGWFNMGDDMRMISRDYPLPRTFRAGLSHRFEISNEDKTLVSIMIANELVSPSHSNDTYSHHGLELGISEAVFLRSGTTSGHDTNSSTWGFGLNLGGLLQTLSLIKVGQSEEGTLGWLKSHVDLSYDYGYADWDIVTNLDFQKISLTIK